MYNANGVGIAAPQINKSIRLFLIDTTPFFDEDETIDIDTNETIVKQVFINPKIIEEKGEIWSFNEGCLSIPNIREEVSRKSNITIEYQDQKFVRHRDTYTGITARVIQHEYDHIEGVLFTDRISLLRKRMIKSKLNDISKGKVDVGYKMKFLR